MLSEITKLAAGLLDNLREAAHILLIRALRLEVREAAPAVDRPFRLIYVGSVRETKGVGDAIRAIGTLRARSRNVELTIIGRGDIEKFKALQSRNASSST
jgi:glycosyltransferase involved in cell wall biosynthesis